MREDIAWVVGGLERPTENNVVKGIVRVVHQVGVGVALNDGQAAGNAGVHPSLADLDASTVNILFVAEVMQEGTVVATDVEHTGARFDEIGDEL